MSSSNNILPSKFTAKTSFGTFQIKITNRAFITIGSKHDCVQISIKPNKTATLEWLGAEGGGCEESGKQINGKDTIAMVDLGFTIMKQFYPDINPIISLRDSSTFHCTITDGRNVSISNMIYNLLINGKTYYQSRFNAYPLYPESQEAINRFVDAWEHSSVLKEFDFENNDLNTLLRPILLESNTWKEFMQTLYKKIRTKKLYYSSFMVYAIVRNACETSNSFRLAN